MLRNIPPYKSKNNYQSRSIIIEYLFCILAIYPYLYATLQKLTMRGIKFMVIVYAITCAVATSFSQSPTLPLIEAFQYAPSNNKYVSAHRGGRFIHGFPENCFETFKHTHANIPQSFLECDVAETKDKTLVLLHDASLDRTTTLSGKLTDFTWSEIKDAYLIDDFGRQTSYRIPLFNKILQWAKRMGVILQVDIKRGVSFANVIHTLEKYKMEKQVIVITYNLNDAKKVFKLNSNILIAVNIRNTDEWHRFKKAGIPNKNIIAFTGTKDKSADIFNLLHANKISCIFGSLGNIDKKATQKGDAVYWDLLKKGVDVFATDNPRNAFRAISTYQPKGQLPLQKRE